jgi:hypothetical protein
MTWPTSYEVLIEEEADKLLDDETVTGGAARGRAERHRLHRRDRQGRHPADAAAAMSAAKACSAICCR